MGLKADLDEVLLAWPKYPWRLKLWLLLSLFLASGSVASLSDVVFRWKGFILDAITFYRRVIASPIATVFHEFVGIDFSHQFIDTTIIFMLVFGPAVRIAFHHGLSGRDSAVVLAGGSLITYVMILIIDGVHPDASAALFAFGLMALGFSAYSLIRGGAASILWFVYLVAPVAITGIAAAISSGLAR